MRFNLCVQKAAAFFALVLSLCCIHLPASGQMRQLYLDSDENNAVQHISFYSPNEGYVAFYNWIGYTTDSGRTFTQKAITINNVNYGSYSNINLTFGFGIQGVIAFDKNNLLVYGDYGLVPSILSSSDGGNTFTLVFYSQYDPYTLKGGVLDMVFPNGGTTGYAVDPNRVLKTTDKGQTWSIVFSSGAYFTHVGAPDATNVDVLNIGTNGVPSRVWRSTDGGSTWSLPQMPALAEGAPTYVSFQDASIGYMSMKDGSGSGYFYETLNGGLTWSQQNKYPNGFTFDKFKLLGGGVGYGLVSPYRVYKTVDYGVTWEPLQDNGYTYLGWSNNDLQCWTAGQVWAGGGHGFLEMTTTGGPTLPAAHFVIDTTGLTATSLVQLKNYSRTGYQTQWLVNGQPLSTDYTTSYTHNWSRSRDSITLINTSGSLSDTLLLTQDFYVPVLPSVSSYSPKTGSTGTLVSFYGKGFKGTSSVSFGGVDATSVTVSGDTLLMAVVGAGATGDVVIKDPYGLWPGGSFTYTAVPSSSAPLITSISPLSGPAGTTVTITGSGFGASASQTAVYFGAMAAPVQSVSGASIVCTVPAGASFGTVTVLNKATSLQGRSSLSYNVTFKDSSNLTGHTFSTTPSYSQAGGLAAAFVDFDGDGKIDILGSVSAIAAGHIADSVMVIQNKSSNGNLSFAPYKSLALGMNYIWNYDPKDLDGDGLPDYVTPGWNSNATAFRNTSSGGVLSMDSGLLIPLPATPMLISIDDLDNDGRNDLIISNNGVSNFDSSYMQVVRNTSSKGALSFAPFVPLKGTMMVGYLSIGDIDGDGLKDIVATGGVDGTVTFISIYHNQSTKGNLSFVRQDMTVPGLYNSEAVWLTDYDGDGRLDLVLVNSKNVCVSRNNGSAGTISFDDPVVMPKSAYQAWSAISGFSGRSKPDILDQGNTILAYGDRSTPGNVVIDSAFSLNGFYGGLLGGADLDMDGKTDLVLRGNPNTSTGFSIYSNQMGKTSDFFVCADAVVPSGLASDVPGQSYQWQMDDGTGFRNVANGAVITGADSSSIVFTHTPASWAGYKFRCLVNGYLYSVVSLMHTRIIPVIHSKIVASDTSFCYGKKVTFTASSIDTGVYRASYFHFQVNGRDTLSMYDNPISLSNLKDGDQVRAIGGFSDSCENWHPDTTNTITVHVTSVPTTVSISASDTNVCQGTTVYFTSTVPNTGDSVSYDWQVNGQSTLVHTPTFWTNSLVGPNAVQLVITRSTACSLPGMSNVINVNARDTVTGTLYISSYDTSICKGASVNVYQSVQGYLGYTSSYWVLNGHVQKIPYLYQNFTSDSINNGDRLQWMVVDSNHCGGPDTTFSNTIVFKVNDVLYPRVTITPFDTTICQGSPVTFTATLTPGVTATSYQWLLNGQTMGMGTGAIPPITRDNLVNGDAVDIYVDLTGTCLAYGYDHIQYGYYNYAYVLPKPTLWLYADSMVNPGQSTHVVATVGNVDNGVAYIWADSLRGGHWQTIGTTSSPEIDFTPRTWPDFLQCTAINANGCSTTSYPKEFWVIGVDTTGGDTTGTNPVDTSSRTITNSVHVYPNPVSSTLTVLDQNPGDPITTVTILTTNGNGASVTRNAAYQSRISIGVGGLNPGQYFVRVQRRSGGVSYATFMKLE